MLSKSSDSFNSNKSEEYWNKFSKELSERKKMEYEDKEFSVNDTDDQKNIFTDMIDQGIPYKCIILGLFEPAENIYSYYRSHQLKVPEWFVTKYDSKIKEFQNKYTYKGDGNGLCACKFPIDPNSFTD
jgi:hypothetical protein